MGLLYKPASRSQPRFTALSHTRQKKKKPVDKRMRVEVVKPPRSTEKRSSAPKGQTKPSLRMRIETEVENKKRQRTKK